jgi:hypothetical protein
MSWIRGIDSENGARLERNCSYSTVSHVPRYSTEMGYLCHESEDKMSPIGNLVETSSWCRCPHIGQQLQSTIENIALQVCPQARRNWQASIVSQRDSVGNVAETFTVQPEVLPGQGPVPAEYNYLLRQQPIVAFCVAADSISTADDVKSHIWAASAYFVACRCSL